jgi:MscS family membrane protein
MFESEALGRILWGNSLQAWLLAGLIIFGAVVLGRLLYWIFNRVIRKHVGRSRTRLDDLVFDMIEEPVTFVVILVGVWYGLNTLTFPEGLTDWIGKIFNVLIILTLGWLIVRLFDSFFREYVTELAGRTATDLDDQLLPVIRTGTKVVIWLVAFIVALENSGYDVGALLAGLGIGGLALAMAAKDTLANIFGGFTIFSDKPFTLNDRVHVAGYDGFVREVGLRSTRIETLAGRKVTIPNSKFADSPVENVSVEPSRKVAVKLGLTYDTTPEQMEKAMELLRRIVQENVDVEEHCTVGFTDFGDFSMDLMLVYYIRSLANPVQVQSNMNMAILRAFNARKLEFAFPTQTLYTKPLSQ